MSVLLPLVCLVHGTALIGTDVEARTIVYLITRRMRRVTVLIVKFAATALVLAVLCDLGMIGAHLCALAGRDMSSLVAHSHYADWSPASDLCCYLMIIPVGVLGFLAIFNLIGLLTARPLALSVFYLIVVEVILSNIPLRARMYTLLHQLRVTVAGVMPRVCDLYELPSTLREELYPQGTTALPELFGVVLVALVLSAVLITLRELMPAKISRE
jgi:ABC-2 type transport system permease protein